MNRCVNRAHVWIPDFSGLGARRFVKYTIVSHAFLKEVGKFFGVFIYVIPSQRQKIIILRLIRKPIAVPVAPYVFF